MGPIFRGLRKRRINSGRRQKKKTMYLEVVLMPFLLSFLFFLLSCSLRCCLVFFRSHSFRSSFSSFYERTNFSFSRRSAVFKDYIVRIFIIAWSCFLVTAVMVLCNLLLSLLNFVRFLVDSHHTSLLNSGGDAYDFQNDRGR